MSFFQILFIDVLCFPFSISHYVSCLIVWTLLHCVSMCILISVYLNEICWIYYPLIECVAFSDFLQICCYLNKKYQQTICLLSRIRNMFQKFTLVFLNFFNRFYVFILLQYRLKLSFIWAKMKFPSRFSLFNLTSENKIVINKDRHRQVTLLRHLCI